MSTRKTTFFYAMLLAVASLAVGMVIASRLDLTPGSSAQTIAVPPMNSTPITGAIDAQTFRNIAKAATPMSGYAYPIAWLLPLVFLIAVGAIGRALTRDVRKRR